MPLPEPRMLGNAVPEAHASGNVPLTLLLLSARMASLGRALFWPQLGGSVPLIWLPANVSSLRRPLSSSKLGMQACAKACICCAGDSRVMLRGKMCAAILVLQ